MTVPAETTPARVAAGVRVPDFFIVGHPKSGTTALYEMLRARPLIYMPEIKETRFFAPELHPSRGEANGLPQTLEDYLALFATARPEQRAGEASPSYLRSAGAAARIAEIQPDARIIALFREPAGFLRSLHLELLKDQVETETDLRKAMELESVRAQESELAHSPGLVYSNYVRYAEQLRRYHAVFGEERVLVLIYEDFRDDNEATVRRVLRFLEADDGAPIEIVEANPTIRVRSPRMSGLVGSLTLGHGPINRALKGTIKALTPERARREALATVRKRVLYGAPKTPDEEFTLQLRRRFKPEVIALGECLDRDLVTEWGYDGIE